MSTNTSALRKGINETLTAPVSHKDSSMNAVRSFDSSLRNINGAIAVVSKHVGTLENKLQLHDDLKKDLPELKHRISSLENTQLTHTKLLTDIYEMLKNSTKAAEPAQAVQTSIAQKPSVELAVELTAEPSVDPAAETQPVKKNKTKPVKKSKPAKKVPKDEPLIESNNLNESEEILEVEVLDD